MERAGGGKTLHHLNTVGIYEMANSGLKYVYPHCFVVDDVSGSGEGNGMVGCIGDSYVVVFDLKGNILGSMFLIEAATERSNRGKNAPCEQRSHGRKGERYGQCRLHDNHEHLGRNHWVSFTPQHEIARIVSAMDCHDHILSTGRRPALLRDDDGRLLLV